jgi:hypothetical protein
MVLFSIRLFCALAHLSNNSRLARFQSVLCHGRLARGTGDLWKCTTGGRIAVWAEVIEGKTGDGTN